MQLCLRTCELPRLQTGRPTKECCCFGALWCFILTAAAASTFVVGPGPPSFPPSPDRSFVPGFVRRRPSQSFLLPPPPPSLLPPPPLSPTLNGIFSCSKLQRRSRTAPIRPSARRAPHRRTPQSAHSPSFRASLVQRMPLLPSLAQNSRMGYEEFIRSCLTEFPRSRLLLHARAGGARNMTSFHNESLSEASIYPVLSAMWSTRILISCAKRFVGPTLAKVITLAVWLLVNTLKIKS